MVMTHKIINDRVYRLCCIKTFRHTFWDCYNDRNFLIDRGIDRGLESWLTMTPEGQWFKKKAIDISWEEHLDQDRYELVVRVKGFLQPKHLTEFALRFLDNEH